MSKMTGAQSVDRAIDLLELLSSFEGNVSLTELAKQTQLSPPTIHRILRTLVARGYARQLPNRRYALGPRAVWLGDEATRQLGAGVDTYLEQVTEELGESANLAILDQDMVTYVAQAASRQPMRIFTEVGRRVHCHCTGVGKVVLSQLSEERVREIALSAGMHAATDRSITEIGALLEELEQIRQQGYAIDDGEQELGVRCYAVPVPNAPTPAALSASGPDARVTYEFRETAVPVLQAAAEKVSIGWGL